MPYIGSSGETNEDPPASRSSLQCWPDLCFNSVRERLEHAREGIQLAHHLDDGRARKTAVLIAFSRQRSLLPTWPGRVRETSF